MANTSKKQAEIDKNIEYLKIYLQPGNVVTCIMTGYRTVPGEHDRYKWQLLAPINGELNKDTGTQGHASAYIITDKVAKVLGLRFVSTANAPSGIWIDYSIDDVVRHLSRILFDSDGSLIVVKYN